MLFGKAWLEFLNVNRGQGFPKMIFWIFYAISLGLAFLTVQNRRFVKENHEITEENHETHCNVVFFIDRR